MKFKICSQAQRQETSIWYRNKHKTKSLLVLVFNRILDYKVKLSLFLFFCVVEYILF